MIVSFLCYKENDKRKKCLQCGSNPGPLVYNQKLTLNHVSFKSFDAGVNHKFQEHVFLLNYQITNALLSCILISIDD